MARPIRLLLLLVLLGVTAAAYVLRPDAQVAELPPPAKTWPGLPYQSENEWIVSQTAVAVLDLARYVADGKAIAAQRVALTGVSPNPASPRDFALNIGDETATLRVDTHVWDPRVYRSLTAGVASNDVEVTSTDDVIAALTDVAGPLMQEQNDALSAAISADPRNAAHHETAAFLLAALAFREASGLFYDPRLILSRVTAHLAVARALRDGDDEATTAGRLAHAMLLVLAGRTRDAVTALDAMSNAPLSPPAHAWVRAVKRRATLDWREVPDDTTPLIERLEYMRALGRMLTTNASLEYFEAHQLEAIPDWGWRTLDLGLTVANGNTFARPTFVLTQYEAATVLSAVQKNDSHQSFTTALSVVPALSAVDRIHGGLQVIDAGTWGAFYQRQLAHVTSLGSQFYRDIYGSQAAAIDFETTADRFVGHVPLWPLVKRLRARNADEYDRLAPAAIQVLKTMPERVPYLAWSDATQRAPKDAKRLPVPVVKRWFDTIFPAGTTFESRRLNQHSIVPQDFVDEADALHEQAPWDPHVTLQWSTVRCAAGCTPEKQRAHFERIADYHLGTVRRFAFAGGDPARELGKLCGMSVDECYQLANWLVSEDRAAEAADAYEHYIRVARDRVGVSNRIEWLVRYYQRVGRADDARRVAESAAQTGSGAGLEALAGFLERAGDAKGARAIYESIKERYDRGHQLLAHFLRRADATGRPPADKVYTQLLERYFGGKIERATHATAPPQKGMRVKTTTAWIEKQGFRVGDVVTAVDGIQLSSSEQFAVLYDRSFDAPLKFTVWRKDHYLTIEGAFRSYYYGVDLEPYVPPATDRTAGN